MARSVPQDALVLVVPVSSLDRGYFADLQSPDTLVAACREIGDFIRGAACTDASIGKVMLTGYSYSGHVLEGFVNNSVNKPEHRLFYESRLSQITLLDMHPTGRLVTIAADSEGTHDERTKAAFFIVEMNRQQLTVLASLLDRGELKSFVDGIVPFSEASAAILRSRRTKERTREPGHRCCRVAALSHDRAQRRLGCSEFGKSAATSRRDSTRISYP